VLAQTAAAATVGGATSEAMGGSFSTGAITAGAITLGNFGWRKTKDFTDANAERAARTAEANGEIDWAKELKVQDPTGNPRTDGTLPTKNGTTWGPKWLNKIFEPVRDFLGGKGMARQGSDMHGYDHAKWTGGKDGWVSRFINNVSKLHDWFNGWGYDRADTGYYVSHGASFDSLFTMYSFAGMPVAGSITAVVLTDPSVTIQAYNQGRRQ